MDSAPLSPCCKECLERTNTFYSAKYGHLDCLKYLHQKGYPWHPDTTYIAVWLGHLDCLKYLHEQGCPWHIDTVSNAAKSGNIDCALYASKNGAPYDNNIVKYVKDKFGITLELPNTSDRFIINSVHQNVDTSLDIIANANNELNNLVDMYLDQINQLEKALSTEQDNCLTLKKNYESLQKEFYILKNERQNTSENTLVDTEHKNVNTSLNDAATTKINELNNLVDMYLNQINQKETALLKEQDDSLALKKNYESLQTEFYILKDAYDKKCSNNN
jgi:hypothetical protein